MTRRAWPWSSGCCETEMKILLMMITILAASSANAERIRVIDGDTIRIDGAKPDHRLVGFNAPETRRAKNDAERELGGRATARLREIVRAGKLDYTTVECACRPGTAGTPRCNYGRLCGTLKSDGVDVGAILIVAIAYGGDLN